MTLAEKGNPTEVHHTFENSRQRKRPPGLSTLCGQRGSWQLCPTSPSLWPAAAAAGQPLLRARLYASRSAAPLSVTLRMPKAMV